jgi:hypothetical protein
MGEPFDYGKNLTKEGKLFENIYMPYFDTFTLYNTKKCIQIEPNFTNKYLNKHGFWIWKPFIIKYHLEKITDGEILIYQDCNVARYDYYTEYLYEYRNNVNELFDKLNIDVLLPFENPSNLKSKHHVKKSVFDVIGLNNKYYTEYPLLNANRIFIRKSNLSVKFVDEWFNYCLNEKLLLPENNSNEDNQLRWHTHDQAILTVLYRKYIEQELFPENAPGFLIKDKIFSNQNIIYS